MLPGLHLISVTADTVLGCMHDIDENIFSYVDGIDIQICVICVF